MRWRESSFTMCPVPVAPDLSVLRCPQCNAPITPPTKWARSAICPFCGASVQVDPSAVWAARFKEAYAEWNAPKDAARVITIGSTHWELGPLIARGESSDVYVADRARTPSQRVIVKILRDDGDLPLLEQEYSALSALQQSRTPGAATLSQRVPDPVTYGRIVSGPFVGRHAIVLRWVAGFVHTLEQVRARHPDGVAPKSAVWVWRRILETLSFVHANGFVHGAVLPQHVLIQRGEHGVRLVGYGCAAGEGKPLNVIVERYESFYPPELRVKHVLGADSDVKMASRCVRFLLGDQPSRFPPDLEALLNTACDDRTSFANAWALREQIGATAGRVFGPPSFNPIEMPS